MEGAEKSASSSPSRDEEDGNGSSETRDFRHISVLMREALELLAVRRGGTYIDATVGLGGHSCEIARRLGAQGRLIGFDKDTRALELARRRLEELPLPERPEIALLHGSFAEIGVRLGEASVDGILGDLGVSSMQFEDAARGFSFQADGPLDMRMDPRGQRTADQVVNQLREEELADVIYEYGQEGRSRRIARAIVRARPIRSTAHLARVISAAAPTMKFSGASRHGSRRSSGIHPATLTFQAIRIFVNRELDDLDELLRAAPRVLKAGGRLVLISFHSLEDRRVKDAFREGAKQDIYRLLTKKPVTAGAEELGSNPRARSAKLRCAERLSSVGPAAGRKKGAEHV